MVVKRLCKIGNSTGVIIDRALLDLLELKAGNAVRLDVARGVLTLRRDRPEDRKRA